ncbi:heavy metal-binding domain-containing protein [Hymenobacter metallilatus]|uniref:heavy metal-binding domain-containing protein n=1 Tax=Hymenobacter metallilatus TaxID=2493666 RepID=UPI00163A068D|nr:heavy metal-binding domain-containing protein [Hymenobacter metallilatus]
MKLMHLFAAALMLAAPLTLSAQHTHKPGAAGHGHNAAGETHAHSAPHGGIVRTAGKYHVELVVKAGQMTVYLLDGQEKTQPTTGLTGTAMVQQGGKTTSVALTPAADQLRGTLPAGATPTTAIITLRRGSETINARFDKLASTAAKAKAVSYACPMGCAGSASTKPGSCPTCGMALVKK